MVDDLKRNAIASTIGDGASHIDTLKKIENNCSVIEIKDDRPDCIRQIDKAKAKEQESIDRYSGSSEDSENSSIAVDLSSSSFSSTGHSPSTSEPLSDALTSITPTATPISENGEEDFELVDLSRIKDKPEQEIDIVIEELNVTPFAMKMREPIKPQFMTLPDEIIDRICSYLTCSDLLAFRKSSSKFRYIATKKMRGITKIDEVVPYLLRFGTIPEVEVFLKNGLLEPFNVFTFRGNEYSSVKMSEHVMLALGWIAATDMEREMMVMYWTLTVLFNKSEIVGMKHKRVQEIDERESSRCSTSATENPEVVEIPAELEHAEYDSYGEGYQPETADVENPTPTKPIKKPKIRNRLCWSCLGKCNKSTTTDPPKAEKLPNGDYQVTFWKYTEGMVLERCVCFCQWFQREKVRVIYREKDGGISAVKRRVEVLGGPTMGSFDEFLLVFCFIITWPCMFIVSFPLYICLILQMLVKKIRGDTITPINNSDYRRKRTPQ